MATGKAAAEASQIIGTHACSSCITHPLIIGYRYRFEINLNQVIHMIICNIAIVYTFLGFYIIASSRSTRGILDNHSQPGDARKWDSAVLQAL